MTRGSWVSGCTHNHLERSTADDPNPVRGTVEFPVTGQGQQFIPTAP